MATDQHNKGPIGIFDSGFGGLTVFKQVVDVCPEETVFYFGDTARLPYGTKSPTTVTRYALQILDFLTGQGIKFLVVACNTVSANALDVLKESTVLPVVGVTEPGAKKAAASTRNGRIGVIGTEATVSSGAYEGIINNLAPHATVLKKACPLFVPLVEEGWTDGPITRQVIEAYLSPLKESSIDTLVLGCTHYPLLKRVIGEYMGTGVTLVDSAEETALEVKRILESQTQVSAGRTPAISEFFVTDSVDKFQKIGSLFLGREIKKIHHIDL
ncbi:glutamate racemase [Acidobacteriota bacterium]